MSAALATLLTLLERASYTDALVLSGTEVRDWPQGVFSQFQALGLLKPAPAARSVPCPECADGHWASVEVEVYHDGPRAYIRCPDLGRVHIPLGDLDQWRFDEARFIATLGRAIGAGQVPTALNSGEFRLGVFRTLRSVHDVVLVMRTEGSGMAQQTDLASPLFLCSVDGITTRQGAAVVPLRQALTLGSDGLSVDVAYLQGSYLVPSRSGSCSGEWAITGALCSMASKQS